MQREQILDLLQKAYEKGITMQIFLERRHLKGNYFPEVAVSAKREMETEVSALNKFYTKLARDFKRRIECYSSKAEEFVNRLRLVAEGNPKEKIPFYQDV